MKVSIPVVLCILLAVTSSIYFFKTSKPTERVSKELRQQFAAWSNKHRRLYSTPAELTYRIEIFGQELKFVERSNQLYKKIAYERGVIVIREPYELNVFADLDKAEFTAMYTGHKSSGDVEEDVPVQALQSAPVLRQQPVYVPRLRDQKKCGSCWAFATIALAEKAYWDVYAQQVDMAHQELLDCDKMDGGCDGGATVRGLYYINNNGITTAQEYPYLAANSECKAMNLTRLPIKGKMTPRQVRFAASSAVAKANAGQINSVSLYASGKFRYLAPTEEVYDASLAGEECDHETNHMITIIGTKDNALKILNSWGDRWGVNGTKTIIPCRADNFLGASTILVSTK